MAAILIHCSCIFWAVGRDIEGVTVAIVNDEAGDCNNGRDLGHAIYNPINKSCQFINISCRFLDSFDYYIEKVSLIQYLANVIIQFIIILIMCMHCCCTSTILTLITF